LLVSGVPHLNSDDEVLVGTLTSGHLHHSDVNWEVAEVLTDFTSWAGNCDLSGLGGNLDCTRKITLELGVSDLPPSGILTKSSLRITLMFQKNAYIFFY
jgi:hypothetical protein